MNQKVLVAMSGGVDSSVAALILKEQGYDCTGVIMRLFSSEDALPLAKRPCCNPQEILDAQAVAEKLEIPFSVYDCTQDFRKGVIEYFINTYLAGGTPNPCVECNRVMKFGKLLSAAREMGCEYVATGHYAKVKRDCGGRWLLCKAEDSTKDQTYVLWSLTQEQLSHTLFPLGDLKKSDARLLAEGRGFSNAKRKESQDICFVPDGDYASFIERYTGKKFPSGNFLDLQGNVLGTHRGCIHYTVGQRKGLGIAFGTPTYVCAKNAANNTVTLGSNEELFSRELTANSINLIALPRLRVPLRVEAKIRYTAIPARATVEQTDSDRLHIRFDEPQRAISPGQSVVLYDGDVVIGGGIIE